MVKAILDGRKTVTRRLIKEIPLQAPYFEDYDGKAMASDGFGDWHPAEHFCRIQPGEILYVRETWSPSPRRNVACFEIIPIFAPYSKTKPL